MSYLNHPNHLKGKVCNFGSKASGPCAYALIRNPWCRWLTWC
jgi:hypothetical protein